MTRPSGNGRNIRLCRIAVEQDPDTGMEELSARERAYCEMSVTRDRWTEWVAGRRAARKAVQALLGGSFQQRPDTWDILPGPHGDPRVHGTPKPVWVSITHAAGMAVAVASLAPIGVDMERPVSRAVADDVSFLRPEEARRVKSMPGTRRPKAATTYWTLKEAAAKAVGMVVSPFEISVRLDAARRTARLDVPGQEPALEGWFRQVGPCLLAVVRGRRKEVR